MKQEDFFREITDAHYEALYRFAYSLAKDPHTAADLTQQAFCIFAEKGHQLRDKSKAKSWLFTTLHREFLKQRRRGQRMTITEDPAVLMDDPQVVGPAESEGARSIDRSTVLSALSSMDELFRAPLVLFYLKQISYKEIAQILEIPIGTVMSRLSRGKEQLRAAMEDSAAEIIPFPAEGGQKGSAVS